MNRVLSADELLPHCLEMAREIQAADRATLKSVQHLISYSQSHDLEAGLLEEARVSKQHAERLMTSALKERSGQVMDSGRQQN